VPSETIKIPDVTHTHRDPLQKKHEGPSQSDNAPEHSKVSVYPTSCPGAWIETVVQDYRFVERLVLDRHGHVPVLDTNVTVDDTSVCLSRTRLGVAWGSGEHAALLTQATGALNSDHIAIASIVLGTAILRLVAAKLALCKSPLPLRHSAQATKSPRRSIDATARPHNAKPPTHRNATHHYTGTAPAILHRIRAGCGSLFVPLREEDPKERRADTLRCGTMPRKIRSRHRFFIFQNCEHPSSQCTAPRAPLRVNREDSGRSAAPLMALFSEQDGQMRVNRDR